MSLIIVRMKMASSQTSTVWFTDCLRANERVGNHLGSDDRRKEGVYVEQDEVPVSAEADRLDQAGIDPR